MTPKNIFLVGPMGAGKSSIGRRLAKALSKDFFDSDKEIEKRTGVGIPLIFELEGEFGFRRREADMIGRLTALDDIVLATGGGSVLDPENRGRLASRGYVIYLTAPLALLLERTVQNRNRPLLQAPDRISVLRSIIEEREPLYRQIADLIVKTNRRSVRHVVTDIVKQITPNDYA